MSPKEMLEIVMSFFAGATLSAVVTVKICKSKFERNTQTTQTGNRAGGNIVGGDYRGR